jgi:tRNA(Ile)-lysidine synthase
MKICGQSDSLITQVVRSIERFRMLRKNDAVLVAVSGGPDSMALLHLLSWLKDIYRMRLGIAHLNHMLRGEESDRDAAFVSKTAANFDLPLHAEKKDIRSLSRALGMSLEETGRTIRYEFFNKVSAEASYTKIAVGHQSDDNAELVLMNLIRGTGPLGLSGIPPVQGRVIRPLIEIERSDIISFLNTHSIGYVVDHSNHDLKPFRNRVRNELIPFLASRYNPRISRSLNRLAHISRDDEQWVAPHVETIYASSVVSRSGNKVVLCREALNRRYKGLLKRIFRRACHELTGSHKFQTLYHMEKVCSLVENGPETGIDLPGRLRISRRGERVIVESTEFSEGPSESGEAVPFEFQLIEPGTYDLDACGYRLAIEIRDAKRVIHTAKWQRKSFSRLEAVIDAEKATFPLTLRNPKPGDRFQPLGCAGEQKLKKFFSDHKVPRALRKRCLVLADGRSILWLVGYRIEDSVKVTATTTRILHMQAVDLRNF